MATSTTSHQPVSVIPDNALAPEYWENARKYMQYIPNISSLFTTAVRYLIRDAEQKLTVPSASSRYCLQRLLNSDSFKAPVYYAALTFKPDSVQGRSQIPPAELAKLFAPDEMAHLITVIYLYRRLRKGCDEAEWKELSKGIHRSAEIGGFVGQAIPNIGFSWGLTLGTMQHLSMALFLRADARVFQKYRRGLKTAKVAWSINEEIATWGCSHFHLGSLLVQLLGVGGSFSKGYTTGYLLNIPEADMERDAYRAKICWDWIEALRTTGKAPNITHRGEFYPLKGALDTLQRRVAETAAENSTSFFARGKEDVSAANAPELNAGAPAATTTIEETGVEAEVLRQVATATVDEEL